MQRAHPVGQSFHLPGESVDNGAHWRGAGGEISSQEEALGERLRDQLGGTGYRPADRQAAAGPLGGERQSKTSAKTRRESEEPFTLIEKKYMYALLKHIKSTSKYKMNQMYNLYFHVVKN